MTDHLSETDISRLLADGYSQRILSNTYERPMSAQRLSKICRIPIAACYRRIHELQRAGMLEIAYEKEIYRGRKVKLYRCRLRYAEIRFSDGKFMVDFDAFPEEKNQVDEGDSSVIPEIPIEDDGTSLDDDLTH